MPVRHGDQTYWYLRRKGRPLLRLPDLPHDHPEFLAAYAAAMAGDPPVQTRAQAGSLAAVVEAALRSAQYREVGEVYRATLRRHFDAIRTDYGTVPARGLRDRHIRKDVAEADNPTDRRKAWRFLCARGFDAGLIEADPSLTVRAPKKPRIIGHPPWTVDEVDRFRARWEIGTVARAVMELLHWTGFRLGDSVMIGPGHVDRAGVLKYAQSKVSEPAYMPWTAPLPAYAVAYDGDRQLMLSALAAIDRRQMTFLATTTGPTRSEKAAGNLIREAARAAGIEKSAHGLRKTRAIALAEAGASAHQIMSWCGWQTLKEAEHYCRLASRRRAVMGTEQDRNSAKCPAPGAKSRRK